MNPPVLSIALCTYNGARHLAEQLESIRRQTRLPDELVASDDGSTDETVALLEAFATRAPFPVRILRQPRNLGVTQNFAAALRACRGDFIALCDQDDVWLPDKLSASVQFFQEHPRCLALFTDATLVNEALQPLGGDPSLWRHVGVTRQDRRRLVDPVLGLSTLAGRYLVTGATMTVRRELLPHALPIPPDLADKVIHDGWLALCAAACGGLDSLPRPTLLYRQHDRQQIGFRPDTEPLTRRAHYRQMSARVENIQRALTAQAGAGPEPAAMAALAAKANHFQRCAQYPESAWPRAWAVACGLAGGNYHRYRRWPLLAALRDLVL